jgi:hypothetical protein
MDLLGTICTQQIQKIGAGSPLSVYSSSLSKSSSASSLEQSERSTSLIQEFDLSSSSDDDDDTDNFQAFNNNQHKQQDNQDSQDNSHVVRDQQVVVLDGKQDTTPSTGDGDAEDMYSSIFAINGNCIQTLFAMASGIRDENNKLIADYENDDLFTKAKKKMLFKPIKKHLVQEVLRRKQKMDCVSKTFSSQNSLKVCSNWLHDNNQMDHVDLVWVTSKINWFRETLKNATANEPQDGVEKFINFRGTVWVLRLIHALSDNDDARLAFATVFNVKDRQALDSRNSPGHVVKTVYEIIADHYNDETFNPWSTAYPRVHSDYAVPIDLTYESVKKFGDISPQKVKDKLAELRCRLNI